MTAVHWVDRENAVSRSWREPSCRSAFFSKSIPYNAGRGTNSQRFPRQSPIPAPNVILDQELRLAPKSTGEIFLLRHCLAKRRKRIRRRAGGWVDFLQRLAALRRMKTTTLPPFPAASPRRCRIFHRTTHLSRQRPQACTGNPPRLRQAT